MFQGLSEMKICHCDPHKCLFHNGKKGPLEKPSDVYEVLVSVPPSCNHLHSCLSTTNVTVM